MANMMNLSQKTVAQDLSLADNNIPTLKVPLTEADKEIELDKLVSQLGDELQAIVHHHLYQAMVKSLHQIIAKEGPKLSGKILDKLHHQLPEIIEAASKPHKP